jgi:DtxR family Mn-dependent transcriptional regulator
MDTGRREDLLEAVYLLTEQGTISISISRLITHLPGTSPAEMESQVAMLLEEGTLNMGPERDVHLTTSGRLLAERVAKKHQILEHFFIEMLGVDPGKASKEACRLEHHISDEIAGRLSELVERSGEKSPSLLDCREGDRVVIRKMEPSGGLHRLTDLGFLPGEQIIIKRKLKNRALVVAVKGCDIALSPDIASLIRVEKTA